MGKWVLYTQSNQTHPFDTPNYSAASVCEYWLYSKYCQRHWCCLEPSWEPDLAISLEVLTIVYSRILS